MVTDLTSGDLAQLQKHGISAGEALRQLQLLRERPAPVRLLRPCSLDDGIQVIPAHGQARLLEIADRAVSAGRVSKFVPASGAATRMFKELLSARGSGSKPSSLPAVRTFFDRLDDLPFSQELRERSGVRGGIASEQQERTLIATLLDDMGYADRPKGLIPFHRLTKVRTAFEEQLLEAAQLARDTHGIARAHLTVAPESVDAFERTRDALADSVQREGGASVEASFSVQRDATDTLALAEDGTPFRNDDGSLLLRPAGHGALIANLNALDADLVVIKNIDNIQPFERNQEVVHWQRLLLGLLVSLETNRPADRPLRVCGVVRNEGEPGGAPFWVADRDGSESLQIVEPAQLDPRDEAQRRIFESSTHFNPSQLVCSVRRSPDATFDLEAFVDPLAVLYASKSHQGRDLTALERPGLWNGAMAGWETVFVEVPGSTFSPVKSVLDLLRPEHQP